jgi:FG-GAP repeat
MALADRSQHAMMSLEAVKQPARWRLAARWITPGQLVATEGSGGDEFAYSVAVNSTGATALVGVPGANGARGEADVFTRSGGTWHLQSTLTAGDGTTGDHFGWSVALGGGGNTAVVGADDRTVGSNSQQGAAYVFTRAKGNWYQRQELTAGDGAANS